MSYPLEGIRVVDLTVVWSGPGAHCAARRPGRGGHPAGGRTTGSARQVSAKATAQRRRPRATRSACSLAGDPGERPTTAARIFNWHARNKLSRLHVPRRSPRATRPFLRLIERQRRVRREQLQRPCCRSWARATSTLLDRQPAPDRRADAAARADRADERLPRVRPELQLAGRHRGHGRLRGRTTRHCGRELPHGRGGARPGSPSPCWPRCGTGSGPGLAS